VLIASLFGSIVRGEMTKDGDIDLLVEFKGRKSLLDLAGLKMDLEDTLRRKFDVLLQLSKSAPEGSDTGRARANP
jgi:predicted nucleotidyltransferase